MLIDVINSDRLDKILKEHINSSRNQLSQLIKSGFVKVNEKVINKPSYEVIIGDKIDVFIPIQEAKKVEFKEDFNISIIYEDEHILVLNKPPFLVIHDAPSVKESTLVDWLKNSRFSLSTLSGEERYGIVHRLDKETSGAIVIAKTNIAHMSLAKQLEDRSMGRYYLAVIDLPLKEDIIVDKPIERNPKNRLKMGIVNGGRVAKSAFKKLLLSKNEKLELISAKLFTGRTHQIRVHLNSLNRHILGDSLYGFKSLDVRIERVFLHAYILHLIHPITNEYMEFVAPLPNDLKIFLEQNFSTELLYETINPNKFNNHFNFI